MEAEKRLLFPHPPDKGELYNKNKKRRRKFSNSRYANVAARNEAISPPQSGDCFGKTALAMT
jgi:hypothetical protein